MKEAAKAGHPRTLEALLPSVLLEAVDLRTKRDLKYRASRRADWF